MPGRRKRARQAPKRRWRDYQTANGRRPVKAFLDALSDADAAEIVAVMKEVQTRGLEVAQHLRGDIYEVKADGDRPTPPPRLARSRPKAVKLASMLALRYHRWCRELLED